MIHDPTIDRTTGATGQVNRMTYADLRCLDAGILFNGNFKGEKIPTLQDVFDLLNKRLLINIELTNYTSPKDCLVEKTLDLVRKNNMQKCVLFSSFDPFNLIKSRRLMPEVPVGLLASENGEGWWARSFLMRWFFPEIIHPFHADVSPSYINSEHQHHRRVHTWTVNDPLEMKTLFDAGVDGIFTDNPALAKKTLEVG